VREHRAIGREQGWKCRPSTVSVAPLTTMSCGTEVENDDLADHGVTSAKLTALKKKIDGFDTISTKPRQSVAKRSAATTRLPVLFRKACRCLSKQLDRLMVQFKSTAPEFYAKHQAARSVVSTGTRSGNVENVVAAPNTTPASKAE
jgi:hypothetical protein